MYERLRKAGRTVAAVLLVVAVAVVAVVAVPGVIGAEGSFVVLTGSMEPHIGAGDVVVVRSVPPEKTEEGDVITFHSADDIGTGGTDRVTHRVIEKTRTGDGVVYRTKGDANEDPDPSPVHHDEVVGEVWFHLPNVGHAILFVQRPIAQVLFTVVPGLILVVSGVRTLLAEAEVVEEDDGESTSDEG